MTGTLILAATYFPNMRATAEGFANAGGFAATLIMVSAIVLGIAAVVAGKANKSDLLSTAGAGVIGVTAAAAMIAYALGGTVAGAAVR